jgi:hypothetical protein
VCGWRSSRAGRSRTSRVTSVCRRRRCASGCARRRPTVVCGRTWWSAAGPAHVGGAGGDQAAAQGSVRATPRERDPQGGQRVFRDRARRRPNEVTAFIDEHRDRFGVEPICRTLGVSASAYYHRVRGERCARVVEDERLLGGSVRRTRRTTRPTGTAARGRRSDVLGRPPRAVRCSG